MHRHTQLLQFAKHFADAVTVRPFFEDLRRSRELSMMLARVPQIAQMRETAPAPTNAAA